MTADPFARDPFRIGLVHDWGIGRRFTQQWYDAIRLGFDEAYESGLLERPVELVVREIEGMPYASFARVRALWRQVVHDEEVLAVIGPHFSFATLALRDEIERTQVPTLMNSGSMDVVGEYAFLLPNGTFPDEADCMLAYLAGKGVRRLGIVRDDNPLGDEYFAAMRILVRRYRMEISSDQVLSTFEPGESAGRAFATIRDSGADGLAYVGYGGGGGVLGQFRALGWNPPRVMSSLFLGYSIDMGYPLDRTDAEGWAGVDQIDHRNPVYAALLDRFEQRYGQRADQMYVANGYDFANVLSEALALAKPQSPAGVKAALEKVRRLPAAIGRPGCHISFGPYDRRGYKGEYVVIRQIVDGQVVTTD